MFNKCWVLLLKKKKSEPQEKMATKTDSSQPVASAIEASGSVREIVKELPGIWS